MEDYIVSIETEGKQCEVGRIFGKSHTDACFAYSGEYLRSDDAAQISLNLPLQSEPFSSDRTRIFFDGLLPEGFMRRTVAGNIHCDENDYLSILYELGQECVGAINTYLLQLFEIKITYMAKHNT